VTLAQRLLLLHEAERLKLYQDTVGKWTIGVGRNLSDRGISHDESRFLFANDINRVEQELHATFPWTTRLDAVRHAVLVDMLFNLGLPRFRLFKRMLYYAEQGDYARAAGQMLASKWAGQVKTRAKRLAAMMATGTVPPEVAI
jgi:lysozyme